MLARLLLPRPQFPGGGSEPLTASFWFVVRFESLRTIGLARELRPRPLGPGRWVIVLNDWSRERLRETLVDSGWSWDELHAIPMLAGQGWEEIAVAPPQA